MSESKEPTCALSALRRVDPEFAQMIVAARANAQACRSRTGSAFNDPVSAPAEGGPTPPRQLPMVPRVYIAAEWPAPEFRGATSLARGSDKAIEANPRPWCDYVNAATLVRAFVAGNSSPRNRTQVLQYYIDSAFWRGTSQPWSYDVPPMMEAYWLRMPIARVSSLELTAFIEANLGSLSEKVVAQRMALLDRALQQARDKGASVRFSLAKHLQAVLHARRDARRAA